MITTFLIGGAPKAEIERFHLLRSQVLHQEFLDGNIDRFDYPEKEPIAKDMAKAYLLRVLKTGSAEDRKQILTIIKSKFMLRNQELVAI